MHRIEKIPKLKGHLLTVYIPGINRFQPGIYKCECGFECTGVNKFETHIGQARRRG